MDGQSPDEEKKARVTTPSGETATATDEEKTAHVTTPPGETSTAGIEPRSTALEADVLTT